MNTRKELHEEIMFSRRRLIQIEKEKGLNHLLTIQTSQKLDGLINEYMKLTQLDTNLKIYSEIEQREEKIKDNLTKELLALNADII